MSGFQWKRQENECWVENTIKEGPGWVSVGESAGPSQSLCPPQPSKPGLQVPTQTLRKTEGVGRKREEPSQCEMFMIFL